MQSEYIINVKFRGLRQLPGTILLNCAVVFKFKRAQLNAKGIKGNTLVNGLGTIMTSGMWKKS